MSSYLDVAIRLGFIFILLGLICAVLNEAIAGIINSRGKMLEEGILSLLHDPVLKAKVYAHPLIQGIQDENDRLPSYISSNMFALALMDILTEPAAANDPDALRIGITNLENMPAKVVLTGVIQNLKFHTDLERLEAWYEEGMDRVSGWYRRTAQGRVLILAVLVTLLMNADALKILQMLSNNSTMSALVVESAKARLEKGRLDVESQPMVTYDNPDDPTASMFAAGPERKPVITVEEKQLLGQVPGWQGDWYTDWPGARYGKGVFSWTLYLLGAHLAGWMTTIILISVLAPLCFDVLSKFTNVRTAGKAP